MVIKCVKPAAQRLLVARFWAFPLQQCSDRTHRVPRALYDHPGEAAWIPPCHVNAMRRKWLIWETLADPRCPKMTPDPLPPRQTRQPPAMPKAAWFAAPVHLT